MGIFYFQVKRLVVTCIAGKGPRVLQRRYLDGEIMYIVVLGVTKKLASWLEVTRPFEQKGAAGFMSLISISQIMFGRI